MATSDWYEQRRTAIHMLRSGCSATEVAAEMEHPLSWVYKWQHCFEQEGWAGLAGRSRAPKQHGRRLPAATRQAILRARSELEAEAAAQTELQYIGPAAVQGRLRKELSSSLPSTASIARVLRAAGMTQRRSHRSEADVNYPHLHPDQPLHLIQVDIVPHFLTGGAALACFNAIDVVSRYPTGSPFDQRRAADAVDFLLHTWREIGLPSYTQVDNEGCFSGGFTHPAVLGQVVRAALWVGTELVFGPVRHPASNGTVERFHQEYDRHVWDLLDLADRSAVTRQGARFFDRYRHSPHHSALKGQTPAEVHAQVPVKRLPPDFSLPPGKLPLTEGRIHFIRQVNPAGMVTVLNLEWAVPEPHPDQGVWVTIEFTLTEAALRIYDAAPDADNRICLATYPFPLKEAVQPKPVIQSTPEKTTTLATGFLINLPRALSNPLAWAIRSTARAAAHFVSTMF